jgi:hypothetical protein
MKKLFFLLLVLPCFSNAQKKDYFTVAFGKDFPKHYHVIGGHLTANTNVGKNIYLGAGTSFLKFDNTENFYFPVYANISFMQAGSKRKVYPLVFIQPGYGIYKHQETDVTTTGGFTFHSSAGVVYPFLFHKKGFATIGYSHYTFRASDVASHRNSWGGRIGMMF